MVKTVNVLFVKVFSESQTVPPGTCLFDAGNGSTGAGCEVCSGLELEAPLVFILLQNTLHHLLGYLLLALNM